MKKLLLIAFLVSGCAQITEPKNDSHIYTGEIKEYLQNTLKHVSKVTIQYNDWKGVLETSDVDMLFKDSIRIILQDNEGVFRGYVFFNNMSFEDAYNWMEHGLQPIEFRICNDSLIGVLPSNYAGFRFEFNTSR